MNNVYEKLADVLINNKIDENTKWYRQVKQILDEKDNVEEVVIKHEEYAQLLNEFIIQIINLKSEDEIYDYTSKFLSNIYKGIIVIINKNNPETNTMSPYKIQFPDKLRFNKIIDFLGIDIEGKNYQTNQEIQKLFELGRIIKIENGLLGISKGYMNETLIKSLVTVFGFKDVYAIGLIREERLFAALQFYTFNKSQSINKEFVETIATQTSIVIQKLYYAKTLKESEEKYRSLIDGAHHPIFVYDLEGNLLLVNKWQEQFNGIKIADYIGKNIKEHMPEIASRYLECINEVAKTKQTLKFETNVMDNHKKLWFLNILTPIVNQNGIVESVLGQAYDITDKKNEAIRIRDNEEKYSAIFQSKTIAITIVDAKGRILEANTKACELFLYSPEEILTLNIYNLASKDSIKLHVGKLKDTIDNEVNHVFESVNVRKDGSAYIALITSSLLKLSTGKFVVATITDISAQKLAEQTILKANKELKEAVAAKDKFFSIIAHDLRGPIMSIINLSQFMEDDLLDNNVSELKAYTGMLKEISVNTSDLLNNLLLWAKSQLNNDETDWVTINLKELLIEISKIIKGSLHNKKIELEINDNNIEYIYADKNMLQVVLLNLFTNAIKFSNNNGKIILNIKQTDAIFLFEVVDFGIGISDKNATKLFKIESSFSTPGTNKEKGAGLGLLLCKEFIEKMGGKIWVESVLGKGSSFLFKIPQK